MKKILDASVVSKWFLIEPGSEQALSYLKDFVDEKYILVIPTLLFYELGNVLWKKNLSPMYIGAILHKLQVFSLDHIIKEEVGFEAFGEVYQNAQDYGLTFYDAAYVTMMQKYDCELVTADKALFNKLKNTFPRITIL